MAKSRRLLADQLKRVDLVIELCDARIPYASRNPDLKSMISGKPGILLLNKEDLADPTVTNQWIQVFRKNGVFAFPINAASGQRKRLLDAIGGATEEAVRKAEDRGIHKTIRAMVVGVPNVGKSTVINMLHGSRISRTGDRPGVTRSQQWVKVGSYLELLDTPGLLWPRLNDQAAARRLSYIGTISDEVVDLPETALSLLEDLTVCAPDCIHDRFHVDEENLHGAELLDAVCRGRGWLLKGNRYDYDRAGRVILDEFRAGKLGRITLEKPV